MSSLWITSVTEPLASGSLTTPEEDTALAGITAGMVAGNEADFARFCQRYSNALHRYCLKVVKGNEADSYELHQQVLIRIARYPKEISDETSLWRWMARVVRTTWIDIHRKQKRYGAAMKAYWEHITVQPAAQMNEDKTLSSTLLDVMGDLPEMERELLEKKYLGGWSYQALAEHFDLSPKAVESRLTRARNNLRTRAIERLGDNTPESYR